MPNFVFSNVTVQPIPLIVRRTPGAVAPDTVQLEVDLSTGFFDTGPTDPSYNSFYNPQYHQLVFLWDTGDPDSWTAPEKTPPEWRAKSRAFGYKIQHCYQNAATYTPSCMIYEPSSGKVAMASATVVVGQADARYSGNQTLCVNPVGDSDFSAAPAGALTTNSNNIGTDLSQWSTLRSSGAPVRVLVKAGATYGDFRFTLGPSDPIEVLIGTYGSGAKPRFTGLSGGLKLNKTVNYPLNAAIRVQGMRFEAGFNPAGNPNVTGNHTWIYEASPGTTLITGCEFDGFDSAVAVNGFESPNNYTQRRLTHWDDCVVTNMGGQYPFSTGQMEDPTGGDIFTGCRIMRNPLTPTEANTYRSPIRINGSAFNYVFGCDIFQTTKDHQCIKFDEEPHFDGAYTMVANSCFEGGWFAFSTAQTSFNGANTWPQGGRNGGPIANFIADGNLILASHTNANMIEFHHQGATVRNNFALQPDNHATQAISAFVSYSERGQTNVAPGNSAPIEVYNNTFVSLRSNSGNGIATNWATTPQIIAGSSYSLVSAHNNILHAPNESSPRTSFAPLDTTAPVWFTPRNVGKVDNSGAVDANFSTGTNDFRRYFPLSGSAAIGAVTSGNQAFTDFTMQRRLGQIMAGLVRSNKTAGYKEVSFEN